MKDKNRIRQVFGSQKSLAFLMTNPSVLYAELDKSATWDKKDSLGSNLIPSL